MHCKNRNDLSILCVMLTLSLVYMQYYNLAFLLYLTMSKHITNLLLNLLMDSLDLLECV